MTKTLSRKSLFARGRSPYWLGFLCFLLLTVLTAFFQEDIALFNKAWANHFTFLEFGITLGAVLVLYLIVGLVAAYAFGVKFNYKVALWTTALVVCVVIGALTLPDRFFFERNESTYYITEAARFRFGAKGVVDCLYLYYFFAIFPSLMRNRRTIDNIMRLAVIAVFGIIAVSIALEWGKYVTYFTQTALPGQSWSFNAFFMNKNIFGMAMILGFFACLYLHSRYPRFYYLFLLFFFTVYNVLIDCRTALILQTFCLGLYLVYRFFLTIKEHPWRNSIAAVFFLFLAVFVVLVIFVEGAFDSIPFIANFGNQIRHSIFEVGSSTMDSRTLFYEETLRLVCRDAYSFFFGIGGEAISYILTAPFGAVVWGDIGVTSTHNGFIFVIAKFGFIGLCIYIGLLGYLFYKVIYGMYHGDRSMGASFFILIGILLHSISENTMLFGSTTQMCGMLIVGVLPILVKYSAEDRLLTPGNLPIGAYDEPKPLRISFGARFLLSVLLFFAAFAVASPSLGFIVGGGRFGSDVFSYVSMGLSVLIWPMVYMSLASRSKVMGLLAFVLGLGSAALSFYLPGVGTLIVVSIFAFAGLVTSLVLEGKSFFALTGYYLLTLLGFLIPTVLAFCSMYFSGLHLRLLSDYGVIMLLLAVVEGYGLLLFLSPFTAFLFPKWLYRGEYIEQFFATIQDKLKSRLSIKGPKTRKRWKRLTARSVPK